MARKTESTTKLLRMKDLITGTGLTRDTIHFYISEGLVPPAKRKRRNMAWYGIEHLERLNAIKRLQQDRFLPLKAIKEVFATGRHASGAFTDQQRSLIETLQREIVRDPQAPAQTQRYALTGTALHDVFDPGEIEELATRGIIDLERDDAKLYVSSDDLEILEGLAAVKKVVDRPEGSWRPEDLAVLDRLVSELLEYEISVFAGRFQDVGSRPIDEVVGTTVPVINQLFGILHMKKIRRFVMAFSPAPNEAADAEIPPPAQPAAPAGKRR